MNIGITLLMQNLGMDLGVIVLIASMLGTIIFYHSDFRIGVMASIFISALNFMFSYALGMNYSYALILLMMFITLLALSFYASGKRSTGSSML
jgi:hypothetical protein